MNWKTLSSKLVYENPFFRVVEHDVLRPNGLRSPYYVLEKHPFSVVIPLTEAHESYLVGQFRYAIQQYSWEFPMGAVVGKNQEDTARQELREETGFVAHKWKEIGQYAVAPGHNNQIAKLYLAQELTLKAAQPEQGELLTVQKKSLTEIATMIEKGEIIDGITICAFHLLEVYLSKIQSANINPFDKLRTGIQK